MQIGSAEQYAQAGDVILSPEVAEVTADHCSVTPLEGNNARLVSMSKSAVVSGVLSVAPEYMMWVDVAHVDCSNSRAVLNSRCAVTSSLPAKPCVRTVLSFFAIVFKPTPTPKSVPVKLCNFDRQTVAA